MSTFQVVQICMYVYLLKTKTKRNVSPVYQYMSLRNSTTSFHWQHYGHKHAWIFFIYKTNFVRLFVCVTCCECIAQLKRVDQDDHKRWNWLCLSCVCGNEFICMYLYTYLKSNIDILLHVHLLLFCSKAILQKSIKSTDMTIRRKAHLLFIEHSAA